MDEDVKDMLQQFIGQTYGEIAKLDQNIVGRASHLRPQGHEFKNVATNILTNIGTPATTAPVQQQSVPAPRAVIQPTAPPPNTGQLEFDFDDSATAKNIFSALKRIEDKLNHISNKLQKLD
jgi:hypothetical protein